MKLGIINGLGSDLVDLIPNKVILSILIPKRAVTQSCT